METQDSVDGPILNETWMGTYVMSATTQNFMYTGKWAKQKVALLGMQENTG